MQDRPTARQREAWMLAAMTVPAVALCAGIGWQWALLGGAVCAGLELVPSGAKSAHLSLRSAADAALGTAGSTIIMICAALWNLFALAWLTQKAGGAFPEAQDPVAVRLILLALAAAAAWKGETVPARCAGVIALVLAGLYGLLLLAALGDAVPDWLRPWGGWRHALVPMAALLLPRAARYSGVAPSSKKAANDTESHAAPPKATRGESDAGSRPAPPKATYAANDAGPHTEALKATYAANDTGSRPRPPKAARAASDTGPHPAPPKATRAESDAATVAAATRKRTRILLPLAPAAIAALTSGNLSPRLANSVSAPFYEMVKGLSLFTIVERFEPLASIALALGYFCAMSLLLCTARACCSGKQAPWQIAAMAALAGAGSFWAERAPRMVFALGAAIFWGLLPLLIPLVVDCKKDGKKSKIMLDKSDPV